MGSSEPKLSERKGYVWRDGELIDCRNATVHVLSHSLHYGSGVFEGVRAYETKRGPAIFRLGDHTQRLLNSAKIAHVELSYTQQQLNKAQLEILQANQLSNAYIRPLVMLDDTSLGIDSSKHKTHVFIAAFAWGAYLGKEGLEKGIQVGTSSFRRHNPNSSMCHAKVCGNYINSVLAKREAINNGFAEALLLDTEGYVSEGTGENIFLVKKGQLFTPDTDNALNGITRQTIITLARDQGIETTVSRVTRDDLYTADEAFFTGTAAEVTPIAGIDRRKIGCGACGVITKKLQDAYFACVSGKTANYHHWLTWAKPRQKRRA